MTVLEAIRQLLQESPEGLTCRELTEQILDRKMYSFNTPTPNSIVNHELRKHCEGLNFPSAHPVKYFTISQTTNKSKKTVYKLICYETNEQHITQATKGIEQIDASPADFLPVEKIARLHKQHIKQTQTQIIEAILNNPPAFFEELVVSLLLKLGYGYNQDSGMVVGKSHDGGEYSCVGVPLFRRNGYRQSGGRKPLFRNRDTALN